MLLHLSRAIEDLELDERKPRLIRHVVRGEARRIAIVDRRDRRRHQLRLMMAVARPIHRLRQELRLRLAVEVPALDERGSARPPPRDTGCSSCSDRTPNPDRNPRVAARRRTHLPSRHVIPGKSRRRQCQRAQRHNHSHEQDSELRRAKAGSDPPRHRTTHSASSSSENRRRTQGQSPRRAPPYLAAGRLEGRPVGCNPWRGSCKIVRAGRALYPVPGASRFGERCAGPPKPPARRCSRVAGHGDRGSSHGELPGKPKAGRGVVHTRPAQGFVLTRRSELSTGSGHPRRAVHFRVAGCHPASHPWGGLRVGERAGRALPGSGTQACTPTRSRASWDARSDVRRPRDRASRRGSSRRLRTPSCA